MRSKKPLKYRNSDQNSTYCGGSCAHLPLPIQAKLGKRQQTDGLSLHEIFGEVWPCRF